MTQSQLPLSILHPSIYYYYYYLMQSITAALHRMRTSCFRVVTPWSGGEAKSTDGRV